MADKFVKLVYHYIRDYEVIANEDEYSYIDLVGHIYSSLLSHVPRGRSVTFNVKYCSLAGGNEVEVLKDRDVVHMFEDCRDMEQIDLFVYNVRVGEISDETMINRHGVEFMNDTTVDRPGVEQQFDDQYLEGVSNTIKPPPRDKMNIRRGVFFQKKNVRNNIRQTATVEKSVGACGEVTFHNTYNDVLSEGSMSFQAVGMTSKCVGTDTGISRNTCTYDTSVDDMNCSGSQAPKQQVPLEQHPIEDYSDSDENWAAKESDELISSESEFSEYDIESDGNLDEGKEDASMVEKIEDDKSDCMTGSEDGITDDDGVKRSITFEIGQSFRTVHHYVEILDDYEVQEGIRIIKTHNDLKRVTAICGARGCQWRIHASLIRDGITFVVKTLAPTHTCTRVTHVKQVKASWIAKKLGNKIRTDPQIKAQTIEQMLIEEYSVTCKPCQIYRAKYIALAADGGSHKRALRKLSYATLVIKTNPGSVVGFQFQDGSTEFKLEIAAGRDEVVVNPQFMRMFVCFNACIKGYLRGCRPFIGLDGCHLKGPFGGILVAAVSVDGNGGIYHVAFGLIESEGKDSWLFFLSQLRTALENNMDQSTSTSIPLIIMSDKQKGLIEAIAILYPEANHRHCSRHLYANFKTQFGGGPELRRHFWGASMAYNAVRFDRHMESIKVLNVEVYEWLMANPLSSWARHSFDHRAKSDHVTNNMSESFNQWVGPFRSKPYLTLLDELRIKVMKRLQKRLEQACEHGGRLTPRTSKKILELREKEAQNCIPTLAGGEEYEVRETNGMRYVVNMRDMTCECGYWVATGVPCGHVAACIEHNRETIEDHCDPFYSNERYILANQKHIHPMSDLSTLDDSPLLPPKHRVRTGRPKTTRRKEKGEARAENVRKKSDSLRCGKCNKFGHNKRSCTVGDGKGNSRKRKQRTENPDDATPSQRVTRSSQQATVMATEMTVQDRARDQMICRSRRVNAKQYVIRQALKRQDEQERNGVQ